PAQLRPVPDDDLRRRPARAAVLRTRGQRRRGGERPAGAVADGRARAMKTVVILGAGDGSLPTYEAAHRLGHHVIGIDRHDWEVAVPLADEFVHTSTAEPDAIVAALGDRPDIVGVVAPSSDAALPTLQVLARRDGTPGLPPPV